MAEPQPLVIHAPIHGDPDAYPAASPSSATIIHVRDAAPTGDSEAHRQSPPPPELAASGSRRAFSLDALRGLFLVAMTVGFTVRGDVFPLWMYHRQFPPPFELAPVAGIAWRDLTYVAFLFTMSAALPLTLSRRIDKGDTEIAIIGGAVRRFLLLLVFALLIGHSNTYFTGYTQTARAVAVAGFVVMALVFTRPKPVWNQGLWKALNLVGWGLAAAFLALTPLLYGKTFSFARIDDVIAGLAFAALAGSVVWYLTRENLAARLGVLAAAVALYLGAREPGWVQDWWWSSRIPWALAPSRLSLLVIVVPGTIAGDAILRWIRARDTREEAPPGWSGARRALLAGLAAAFAPVLTIGMYTRAGLLTTQLVLAMTVAGVFLTGRPSSSLERMLRSLFLWGAAWLVLGLWMEPFEGGMKKVPETLSYFFAVTGVSVMLLVALTAVVDGLGRRRWVSALIDVGHNPMLCYVLYTVLLNSALEMIPAFRGVLRQSAGEIVLRMVLETLAVILIVRFFARRRIYWRT
ncbi:MAG TPA: DUF5009 domain-containing protein [Gemmatimonadaceae bacterium]|nr:DUF5009 domain-containing protein [Gemmatimonadaceae bacterium]